MHRGHSLYAIYETLNAYFGDLHWWPGDSPFEIIVGAILTQNTAWKNVESVISKLKSGGYLNPEVIFTIGEKELAAFIRPAGYYNIKTRRLKSFTRFLYEEYRGDLECMFAEDLWSLRGKLLGVNGIGEETADSILLYAGNKPVFVIDAYTRRILLRHNIIRADATYTEIQNLFMSSLPQSVPLYNQYHALLVNTGKFFCNRTPRCNECPLSTKQ